MSNGDQYDVWRWGCLRLLSSALGWQLRDNSDCCLLPLVGFYAYIKDIFDEK